VRGRESVGRFRAAPPARSERYSKARRERHVRCLELDSALYLRSSAGRISIATICRIRDVGSVRSTRSRSRRERRNDRGARSLSVSRVRRSTAAKTRSRGKHGFTWESRVAPSRMGGGEGNVRDSTSSGNFCEMPFAAVDRRRRFILTYRREARRHLRVLIANYRRLTRRD